MDFPHVMEAKEEKLLKANAQCTQRTAGRPPEAPPTASKWPLKAATWQGLGIDLSSISNSESAEQAAAVLREMLAPTGFVETMPTVWVLEAVLYYMPLARAGRIDTPNVILRARFSQRDCVLHLAEVLLGGLAALSRKAGLGTLIATCVDTELLEASQNLEASHIFSQLWYFDVDELQRSLGYANNWRTTREPETTKALAQKLYGADTFVALYGGSECAFTACLS